MQANSKVAGNIDEYIEQFPAECPGNPAKTQGYYTKKQRPRPKS